MNNVASIGLHPMHRLLQCNVFLNALCVVGVVTVDAECARVHQCAQMLSCSASLLTPLFLAATKLLQDTEEACGSRSSLSGEPQQRHHTIIINGRSRPQGTLLCLPPAQHGMPSISSRTCQSSPRHSDEAKTCAQQQESEESSEECTSDVDMGVHQAAVQDHLLSLSSGSQRMTSSSESSDDGGDSGDEADSGSLGMAAKRARLAGACAAKAGVRFRGTAARVDMRFASTVATLKAEQLAASGGCRMVLWG